MLGWADEPCDMCKNRFIYRGLTGDFVGSVHETPPDWCFLDLFIIFSFAFLPFESTIAILVFPPIPLPLSLSWRRRWRTKTYLISALAVMRQQKGIPTPMPSFD